MVEVRPDLGPRLTQPDLEQGHIARQRALVEQQERGEEEGMRRAMRGGGQGQGQGQEDGKEESEGAHSLGELGLGTIEAGAAATGGLLDDVSAMRLKVPDAPGDVEEEEPVSPGARA